MAHYCSRGGPDSVVAHGRVLMEDGIVKTIDEAATLDEVQRRGEALAAASGLGDLIKPKWPVE